MTQPVTKRFCAGSLAEKSLCAVLVASTLLYCGSVFVRYAANVGQADDFVDVLWFIEIFRSRETVLDALAVLFLPNHEHITLFNHLVYVAQYLLTGKVSFLQCMVIGQLIVLGCCIVLIDWLRRWLDIWYATAVAVPLFANIFYWHAGFWAMTALSNQGVILFALLAARASTKDGNAVWQPLGWAVAATATQFNGLLVLPALLAGRWWSQCRGGHTLSMRQWMVWSLAAFALMAAYVAYENPFEADHLWRYVNVTDPGREAEYAKPTGEPVSLHSGRMLWGVQSVFALAGASVFDLQRWQPAVLVGLLLAGYALQASLRGNAGRDGFFMVMMCFVAASVLLVGIGRGGVFGPAAALLYRYRLYPFLLLVLLAGAWVMRDTTRRQMACLLAAGLLVQLLSLHVMDDIAAERSQVQRSHYFWLVDGGMGRSEMPFYPHNQDWRLFNAYRDGYYNPYEALPREYRPAAVGPVPERSCSEWAQPGQNRVMAWSKRPRALAAEIRVDGIAATEGIELLFCSGDSARRVVLDSTNVDSAAGAYYPVAVLKTALPPGEYRVRWRTATGLVEQPDRVSFP